MSRTQTQNKIIYIMGCGRSGTTITGFILGNGYHCLDLGEVADVLKRNGQPNGFGPETENGKFWHSVTRELAQAPDSFFEDETKNRLCRLEHHKYFLPLFLGLVDRQTTELYQRYINTLYKQISASSAPHTCFIDSSKYPGRALLLLNMLPDFDVRIIHLVRHPVKVVDSFGDKTKKQNYKGFISANLYYFIINFFCTLVKFKTEKRSYIKIRYEDLLARPEETIGILSRQLNTNLDDPLQRIAADKPLKRGFIFNGNRMRMKNEVILLKQTLQLHHTLKGCITMMINRIWY